MDTVTADGDASGFVHLVTGYPPPDWDVERQMVEAEPFFRYVLHDGLARAGRADLVAEACRDWRVFLDAGETTWPECWIGGTRCHGWSSTPTRDLIVHVLGIRPGCARVRIGPGGPGARRPRRGPGPPCPPRTGRSPWRPTPTAASRWTARCPSSRRYCGRQPVVWPAGALRRGMIDGAVPSSEQVRLRSGDPR